MRLRDYELSPEAPVRRHAPPQPRRRANPVAELQRSLGGNQATASVLARKGAGKNKGTFAHSLRIGKLGPIEIKDSNVDDISSDNGRARDLIVTTAMGTHSKELEKMAAGGGKVDAIEITTITGQNTWTVVTIKHGVIEDYEADKAAKTERWKLTRFDAIDIKKLAIGAARP